MAINGLRLMAIFVIGYYIPVLIALRFFCKHMTNYMVILQFADCLTPHS